MVLGVGAAAVGILAGFDPKLALIATAGFAFVLVVLADVTIGLCLFALLTFVDQLTAVEDSVLSLTKFVGILLAASWLAGVATANRARTFFSAHPAATYVLALFLTWTALSVVWSESLNASVEAFVRYGLNIVLFLIVFTAVSDRRRALWVIGAFVLAASASSAYGILNPAQVDSSEGVTRVGGAIGEPNEFAALLVAGLFLAVALARAAMRSPALRLAALGAAALCTGGIFLSVSRAGVLALGVALLAGVFLAGRWRPAASTAAVLVAVGGLVYFTTFAPVAGERFGLTDRGAGRVDIWTIGWRMVEDRPVTGVGAGNFTESAVHYLLEPGGILRDEYIVITPKVAHNVYLQVLAELGVVGLACFLAILVFSLTCALKAARRFEQSGDVAMEAIARGVLLALIGLLVADFFASEQYSKQLWLLLGFAPALLALASRPQPQPPPSVLWQEAPAPAGVP